MKRSVPARTDRLAIVLLVGVILILAGCQTGPETVSDDEPETGIVLKQPSQAERNLPAPVGWVNDFADIISPDFEQEITSRIEELRNSTGSEIAVLTVHTFAPYPTIDEFSLAVANDWAVGSAERDDGVLITVALEERGVRIEVGYGLEGALPDEVAGQILDDIIIPHLAAGDFGAGLLAGVEAIAGRIVRAVSP